MKDTTPRHLRKRSFRLAGHRTSVALEPEFWEALEALAEKEGRNLSDVVEGVDGARSDPTAPLASALRVFMLKQR